MVKIGLIIGSTRKNSYSRAIANQSIALLPDDIEVKEIKIDKLPLYNQDLDDEGNPPTSWINFRKELKEVDGIIFVTPEHNRSVPAALKNAIDVGSRPYGENAWDGKPAAIISQSPGSVGGFGANHHLRQMLVFLNMPTLQQPEAYIGNVTNFLDDNLKVINDGTIKFLKNIMDDFVLLLHRYKN